MAGPLEKRGIRRYAGDADAASMDLQPVFIVGAPRSGSTALYQALTECLDLLYIDNLAALFYRNLYFGMWLSRTIFGDSGHGCFRSEQGSTGFCGLHAPAECGDFWYRWLPREPHYIPKGQLGEAAIEEIRQTLYGIIHRFRRPLLFKNLNAGQRMGMLSQIVPNAKFIYIFRDPLYNAQSIMEVKREKGLDPRAWWSIMPKNYKELLKLDAPAMAMAQVFYLERQIMEDREYFSPEQCIDIRYEDFCWNVPGTIRLLRDFISAGAPMKRDPAGIDIDLREEQTVESDVFDTLKEEYIARKWERYDPS